MRLPRDPGHSSMVSPTVRIPFQWRQDARCFGICRSGKLVQAADSGQPDTVAAKLSRSLESLRSLKVVGDVRGIGLLWGVEFVSDKASKLPFAPRPKFLRTRGESGGRAGVARLSRPGVRGRDFRGPCATRAASDHYCRTNQPGRCNSWVPRWKKRWPTINFLVETGSCFSAIQSLARTRAKGPT